MNIDCTDSEKFYELNRILGLKEETSTDDVTSNELTSSENIKSHSAERYTVNQNKENNQRFKAPTAYSPNRIPSQTGSNRNQIARKTTTIPYINTERISQTTNYREPIIDRSETTTFSEFIPSTTFPPVNIAQFFNYPTTTLTDNSEYTTDFAVSQEQSSGSTVPIIDFITNKYDSNTRIIPDLLEESSKKPEQSKADEVVESIKQLQKLYPSNVEDSREKRFLFKADSIKNRQNLFEILNQ